MSRAARRAAACLLALAAAVAPGGAADPGPGRAEKRLLDLVNGERSRKGIPPLVWHPVLAEMARRHAEDMREAGRISHRSSRDGSGYNERLARSGLKASAGAENVAFAPDVERAHRGLMESPGHRANILDRDLTAVGIGIVRDEDNDAVYVAQNFAAPLEDLTDEEAEQKVRSALLAARRRSGRPELEEDRSLSRRMARLLEELVEDDSVEVGSTELPGPGSIVAYTSMDPEELPGEAARRVRDPAAAFGLAVAFRRTPSYPFGAYWVVLALAGRPSP
ncbi:MAG TPA: CAP domain-containing protein [Candidatus Polarisedimenticolia bacterium]|nr:CAP domain-containing protein [Candidatus Polarisedimenticolia bacterium]